MRHTQLDKYYKKYKRNKLKENPIENRSVRLSMGPKNQKNKKNGLLWGVAANRGKINRKLLADTKKVMKTNSKNGRIK